MKTILVALLFVVALAAGWSLACYHATHGRSWICPEQPQVTQNPAPPAPTPVAHPTVDAPSAGATSSSAAAVRSLKPSETALAAAIETLTSPGTSFAERRKLMDTLRDSGQIQAVAAILKRMAAENPDDALVSLALGEAEIRELQAVAQNNGSFNQQGVLALQADSDFDAALTKDPTNWEAQFEKAVSLSHWPANLGKGPEVITLLTALVAQQQNMTAQPEFAESYLVLGQAYQAAGQQAQALQTWQNGAALFPINAALQQRIAAAQPN